MAQTNVTAQALKEEGRNSSEPIPEWILARDGIKLIINDKGMEAEKLFLQYPNRLVMCAGYAFTLMMDAVMTFEEDKLDKALATLREVENMCTSEDGWLKAVKSRVFGESSSGTGFKTYAQQLETQIILADSQVCIATLTFLQQDITGYLKGGWVLRKAWKIYQKLFKEILGLYEENIGQLHLSTSTANLMTRSDLHSAITSTNWDIPEHLRNGYTRNSISHSKSAILNSPEISKPSSPNGKSNKPNVSSRASLSKHLKKSFSLNTSLTNFTKNSNWDSRSIPFSNSFSLTSISSIFSFDITKEKTIEKDVIIRLMGAVCFGYGLFQLGVSLLPPSLIRLINLFGFSTNRENGLACLMYARLGSDMRSPLATLCLLWYHTIVRPFYAIDGTNVQAGVETSLMLLKESEEEFGQSSIFLFYYGRAYRLNSDIQKALAALQQAIKRSYQRELKILCLHEVGWCHLIELQYCEAKNAFKSLKTSSRWSKAFYCYLSTICIGACDQSLQSSQIDELKTFTNQMPKGMQLDEFLAKRLKCCLPNFAFVQEKEGFYWRLLIFEMLYLWNALPSCSKRNIAKIISDCSQESDEPMTGLSKLILGCAYTIINDYEKSIASFRVCLDLRKNLPKTVDDAHVSAFAQYELSALLLRNEQTRAEGRELLQQMGQYSHFDFDQKLHVRVNSLLKHSS